MRSAAIWLASALAACVLVGATTSAAQPLNAAAAEQLTAKVVMPNVVGMRMDQATRTLQKVGLRVNEECSGLFGCVLKSRWWVCTQDPRAGRKLNKYTVVVIYAERRGEC